MGKMVDQFFGQPVREVLLILLLAHIHERKHRDGLVAYRNGGRRRLEPELPPRQPSVSRSPEGRERTATALRPPRRAAR